MILCCPYLGVFPHRRESRYLLLLTENYGGLSILSENLLAGRHVVRIFGSSFPKDQEYTQVCCFVWDQTGRLRFCVGMHRYIHSCFVW